MKVFIFGIMVALGYGVVSLIQGNPGKAALMAVLAVALAIVGWREFRYREGGDSHDGHGSDRGGPAGDDRDRSAS